MPPITKVTDQNKLVSTEKFPYGSFPFEKFNPVQSRFFDYYNSDCNCIVAAVTSSGKTVISELALSYEIRANKRKGIYVCPLKSLAQEKYDDWTSEQHHFSDLNISICTGDYQLTDSRKKELDNADLIIMTAEMLNSRVRNSSSEKSQFLKEAGVLTIDEFHTLTETGRGDHLEVALMNFLLINKECRVVGLSATMPNVDEIAKWVSYVLNKKKTVLINSQYRPCPLFIHFEKYQSINNYDLNERQKVNLALDIVDYYPEDKFLIFVHTKATGRLLKKSLDDLGITAEFHNADLSKETRIDIENRFKYGDLRVIVATSTLAAGINTPARRVIVLGIHRGLVEVESYSILQMAGRSGRPLFDDAGDAYILLPSKDFDEQKDRIEEPHLITSQMLKQLGGKYKILAFHVVSEIYQENINSRDDLRLWFRRSLAYWQTKDLPDDIIDDTLESLKKCGAIWEEDDFLSVTGVGKVASIFYYSPFDVASLKNNFNFLFKEGKELNDYHLSIALGNLDTHRFGIVSRAERHEMTSYANAINHLYGLGVIWEPAIKAGFVYYILLNGMNYGVLSSVCRNFQYDFPRLMQVVQAIDGYCKWNKKKWFDQLELRMKYGVKSNLVNLCRLPHIGKARAAKLWKAGIREVSTIAYHPEKLRSVINLKNDSVEEIVSAARKLLLSP